MAETRTALKGLQADIEELRSSNVWLSAAPVTPIAFAVYVFAARLPDPATGTLPGVILLLLAPAVWWLVHKSHYRVAAAALICGLFCANLLLIHWRVPEEAVIFLALPVGLSAVLIGFPVRRRCGRRLLTLSAVRRFSRSTRFCALLRSSIFGRRSG